MIHVEGSRYSATVLGAVDSHGWISCLGGNVNGGITYVGCSINTNSRSDRWTLDGSGTGGVSTSYASIQGIQKATVTRIMGLM